MNSPTPSGEGSEQAGAGAIAGEGPGPAGAAAAQEPEDRRDHRARQTRDQILRAARDVMLETGATRLSLREVARRAHFSPAALYKYFANRDEIIALLAAESLRRLLASLELVSPALPPDERLVELGLAYMGFAEQNPADLRCILAMAAGEPSVQPEEVLVTGVAALDLLDHALRDGVSAGIFRPLTPAQQTRTAFGYWALVHGMTTLAGVNLALVGDQVQRDPRGVLEDYIAALRPGAEQPRES